MEPLELLGAGPLLTICKERTVGDAHKDRYVRFKKLFFRDLKLFKFINITI